MKCIDCPKLKRSSKGVRCASCSAKHGATLRRERRGLLPKKAITTFSIKVIDPNTGDWECWISIANLNGGQAGSKRTYWESADEIWEFFYTEHIGYLRIYRFGIFKNNKLIESLN